MLFPSERETSALISHELAYGAVREAFIAAVDNTTTSFPGVLGHGSMPENRFSVKSASTAALAGLKTA